MTDRLAVVVLAGGAGSRMGGEKPRRRLGRTTLIGHALDLAQAYGRQVAVAVRDETQVADVVEARLLLDDPNIEGPLAGLASALAFARDLGAAWVLTLPCDSPRLPPDFSLRLQRALRRGQAAALARSSGRLHPTCALWRVDCLEALPAYLESGRRSLKGFAAAVGMTVVDWPVVETDPFANANTLEELAALQPHPPCQPSQCI